MAGNQLKTSPSQSMHPMQAPEPIESNTSSIPQAPVHYLSAMVILALDWVWSLLEGLVTVSVIGMIALPLLSFVIAIAGFTAVYSIQYFVAHDRGGEAFAKGVALGILAAVPFPVVGTAIGVPLLAWAGLSRLKTVKGGEY